MIFSNFIIKKSTYGDYRLILYNQENLNKANETEKPKKTKRSDTLMYYYTIDNDINFDDLSDGDKNNIMTSFNRSHRIILDLAMNNAFQYFATFTFDIKKIDRHNIDLVKKKFLKAINNYNAKFKVKLKYVAVPEWHEKKDAIHFHCLMSGFDTTESSNDFHIQFKKGDFKYIDRKTGYKVFADRDEYASNYFFKRFGWNFIILIVDYEKFVAYYIVKYVNKDTCRIFYQRYFRSLNLKMSDTHSKGQLDEDYKIDLVPDIDNGAFMVYTFNDEKVLQDFINMQNEVG